ncbi:hypothetical protein NJ76_28220 [Rhodococcus sp. IITR03]|nr:hypothetical protein NJ76_28220 [Rhodococcus sp. IITR03]
MILRLADGARVERADVLDIELTAVAWELLTARLLPPPARAPCFRRSAMAGAVALPVQEAADRFGISRQTVLNVLTTQKLPGLACRRYFRSCDSSAEAHTRRSV